MNIEAYLDEVWKELDRWGCGPGIQLNKFDFWMEQKI